MQSIRVTAQTTEISFRIYGSIISICYILDCPRTQSIFSKWAIDLFALNASAL